MLFRSFSVEKIVSDFSDLAYFKGFLFVFSAFTGILLEFPMLFRPSPVEIFSDFSLIFEIFPPNFFLRFAPSRLCTM